MQQGDDAPRSVRFALRLFQWCLRMLPEPLRRDFGVEIGADFRELAKGAHGRGGALAVLLVLLRSTVDVLLRSLSERWVSDHESFSEAERRLSLGERIMLLGQELRLALRGIIRRPGFTTVAVLTLALGIGANVAIFAVVNAVLIRPLPYTASERIVWFNHHAPGLNLPEMESSAGTITLYRELAKSYESIAAIVVGETNLSGTADPARITVLRTTPSIFDVLRLRPEMGRRLIESDAARGAPRVALLSYRGWQTHFGGARDVIGRTIRLDDEVTEIVGVMPKHFAHPTPEIEVVVPMLVAREDGFSAFGIGAIARLAPGATLEAARAEAIRLQPRISELYPDVKAEFLKKAGWRVTVVSMRDRLVGDAETALWIVLGTVGFLLLVACASVANLFLVRAEGRQREVGIRFALGATRSRVASTFLSESLVLGIAGGAWGLLLAFLGVRAIVAAAPPQLPRVQEISVDLRVMLFAAAVSIAAGLVFGILPLPGQMRRPLHGLARAGRGHTIGRDRQRVRKALIVTQIALAVVLITGSGLMLRSFNRLRAVDPGIRPDGVLTLGVSIGEQIEKPRAAAAYQRMVDEMRSTPGARYAAVTNSLPLRSDGINGGSFFIKSKPRAEGTLPPVAMYSVVSDGFFQTMGIPIHQGRGIERADHENKRSVAVVNESFARSFLDGKAMGEFISFGDDSVWIEIVGVVGDVRTFGLREEIRPTAYLPMTTHIETARIGLMYLVARTDSDPIALVPSARAVVRRVAPATPVTTARTMNDVLRESVADTSFTTTILLIAALVALALGAIGLYGVIGYVVSQRTQEIGVRIALGAIPSQVRTMVLRQGLVLAGVGVALGLGAAVALTRVLQSLLFEVDSRDPLTFALVPAVMLTVSGIAAYLPARRASSVSPLEAIRAE
jgi:putative ABC transport system permease protein